VKNDENLLRDDDKNNEDKQRGTPQSRMRGWMLDALDIFAKKQYEQRYSTNSAGHTVSSD